MVSVTIKGGVEASCAATITTAVTATPLQATLLCSFHCCHCLPHCHPLPWMVRTAAASSSSNDNDNRNCNPVVDNKDNNNTAGDLL
jgi:hypothetical protein